MPRLDAMNSFLLLVISVIFFLCMIYLIRVLRTISRKISALSRENKQLNRENQQLNREIRTLGKNLSKEMWQHYRQGENYQQLIRLLNFTCALPPTRSFAASPDLLLTLAEIVKKEQPKLIVELGSGVSTLVMAKALPLGSQTKIISFDDSPEYAEKTRQLLANHRITGVEIRVAPIEKYDDQRTWYTKGAFSDVQGIGLLVIDGPPGSKDPQARSAARLELLSRLNAEAIVIIDDTQRDGERELAEQFAQELPTHNLIFLPHEKGTAIISPKISE